MVKSLVVPWWKLILNDEIQTGFSSTDKLLVDYHGDIEPDATPGQLIKWQKFLINLKN